MPFMAAVTVGTAPLAAGDHGPGRASAWLGAILAGALTASAVVLFFAIKRVERRRGSAATRDHAGVDAREQRADSSEGDALRKVVSRTNWLDLRLQQ
jgi:type IV secretory pathway TrbL component